MIKATKKRNVIIVAILLVLTIFAGFFTLFNKDNKIKAGAATNEDIYNTNGYLYFTPGAMPTDSIDNFYRMRFILNIYEEAFDEGAGGTNLCITFIGNYLEEGFPVKEFIAEGYKGNIFCKGLFKVITGLHIQKIRHNNKSLVWDSATGDYDEWNQSVVVLQQEDLTFTDGLAQIEIEVWSENVNTEVQLEASIGTVENMFAGTNSIPATSSKRSVMYLMNALYEHEPAAIENNPYISHLVEMSKEADTFKVSNSAWLNPENAFNLAVSLPTTLQDELMADEVDANDKLIVADYIKKYLVVTRSTTDSFIAGSTSNALPTGTAYEHYWFTLGGSTNFCGEPSAETLYMHGGTVAEIHLPLPSDVTKTYYYYAQIVTKTHRVVKEMQGWTQKETTTDSVAVNQKTSNYISNNVKALAEEQLTNSLYGDANYYAWLQDVAGVSPSTSTVNVTVHYKRTKAAGSRTIVDDSFVVTVPSAYAYNKAFVLSSIYNVNSYIKSFYDFNVVATASSMQKDQSSGQYLAQKTGDRILLQALSEDASTYTYDESSENGTLTIAYNEFLYSNFAMQIFNNHPDIAQSTNNLIIDVYTPHVSVSNNQVTMVFNQAEILQYLYNVVGWKVDAELAQVDIKSGDGITITPNGGIYTVSFNLKDQDNLKDSYICLRADIVQDFDIQTQVQYVKLSMDENGDMVKETITTEPIDTTWCDGYLGMTDTKFLEEYGAMVENALKFDGLIGNYMTFKTVTKEKNFSSATDENRIATYVVEYDYRTTFQVKAPQANGEVKTHFVAAEKSNTLTYYADELLAASNLPTGYYVKNVATMSPIARVVNNADYTKTTIDLDYTNKDVIVPVTFTLSDEWNLKVNYMESWKTGEWITPFATQKTGTFTAKYSTYPNMLDITADDVAKIMGKTSRDDLMICGIAKPYEDVTVTFDGVDTYTTTLEYGSGNITSIGVNGETNHIDVPLTSFTDWAKTFMPEDSTPNVLMLNTKDKKWFTAGDVRSEDVYGYFAVAVFDTKVSDLDSHFQKNTGDGCMNIYATKQVKGSALYQFFGSMQGKGIITNLIGEICMAFCEIVNNENVVQYSHFFYLDGSSENPYISIGGADSPDDDASAGENWGEDVKDEIEGAINDFWNGINENPMMDLLGMVVGAVVIGVGVAAIIWIIRWAFGKNGSSKNNRRKR